MGILEIIIVLIEGILSFFSPCILPVLPVYLSILSNSGTESESFLKSRLLKNTIFFVLGISMAFFLLGLSIQLVSPLLVQYQNFVTLIGGMLIIIMGLFYLGIIRIPFLNREKRIQIQSKGAFLLGFTFSFGWTPCIGPMLASVLMMSIGKSFMLIFVYTLGFIIPFLLVALCYSRALNMLAWIKCHMDKIKLLGGIVLIFSGAYMVWGSLDAFNNEPIKESNPSQEQSSEDDKQIKAIDFELVDQYGIKHQLSQYEGKIVYLTFWTTWCKNCVAELPILDNIYEEYGKNKEDVVILTIASPNVGQEGDEDYIKSYLEEHGISLPVLMDEGGIIASYYGIQAVPTNFVIKANGDVLGYIPGRVGEESIRQLIEKLKEN